MKLMNEIPKQNEVLKELYLKNSRLPKRYLEDATLFPVAEDYEAFAKLKKVDENINIFVHQGQNLLITSNETGNGKTSWAAKILKSYINDWACRFAFDDRTPALFINVPEFLAKKKLAINDPEIALEISEIEKCIFTSKLVVFDDIATKSATQFEYDLLYMYINYRTNNLLTSIYTTNISKDRLAEELDERLADRIIGFSITQVEFKSPSRRGN